MGRKPLTKGKASARYRRHLAAANARRGWHRRGEGEAAQPEQDEAADG